MTCKKPENNNKEERAQLILKYLKLNKRFCTKEEIADYLGCSERIVADCVNYLRKKKYMIVAVTTEKGYKLIGPKDMDQESADYVKQMWMETDSRIKDLEEMKKVCINYWNYRENFLKQEFKKKVEEMNKIKEEQKLVEMTKKEITTKEVDKDGE